MSVRLKVVEEGIPVFHPEYMFGIPFLTTKIHNILTYIFFLYLRESGSPSRKVSFPHLLRYDECIGVSASGGFSVDPIFNVEDHRTRYLNRQGPDSLNSLSDLSTGIANTNIKRLYKRTYRRGDRRASLDERRELVGVSYFLSTVVTFVINTNTSSKVKLDVLVEAGVFGTF